MTIAGTTYNKVRSVERYWMQKYSDALGSPDPCIQCVYLRLTGNSPWYSCGKRDKRLTLPGLISCSEKKSRKAISLIELVWSERT